MTQIKMTPPQKEWAEWAIAAMVDLIGTDDAVELYGIRVNENEMPKIEGNILALPDDEMILDDLLYRLEEQACDVAGTDAQSGQQKASRYSSAEHLASAIREAIL